MGYIKHHAILVTSWSEQMLARAHKDALTLGLPVSAIVISPANGYQSFFVAPDGSKEEWEVSDSGNERREKFRVLLNATKYSDGSTSLEWCEVSYGNDDRTTKVEHDAWKKTP